jgi:predicted ATPase/DNA-binding SARP family transcriptional activator
MQYRLLGPLQVVGDRAPLSLGQPKQRALLACLLLRRGRFASRDELIEALWGQQPPKSAVGSLHVYVHGLRRLLGAERIQNRGMAYRIQLEPGELDLEEFEELVQQSRDAMERGEAPRAVSALEAALGLWHGLALGGLPPELLAPERAHLAELHLSALELLMDARLAAGDHERVIAHVSTLIAEHPFRERLREQQILALYRAGRQKDALEAYRQARNTFVEEIGIEPGPRLRDLEGAILRQEAELAAPESRSPAPEAPGVTGAQIALPAAPTRLIGREPELAEVEALFNEDEARLVTLTGPGGTGKTRLALAIADRLASQLSDGARFIDLSATSDPALVVPVIAEELGVDVGPSLLDSLVRELRPLRMLLVLDNLERLLPAATALAELLSAAPGLLMLATSRAPLRLRAEYEYPVPPLALPESDAQFDAIARSDAVQLLVTRARAVNRSCALTESSAPAFAQICRGLDGLPLALELAASRMRALSPEAVAAGLDRALDLLVEGPRDLPTRQRTLRATLDWSHEQLRENEQRVFAQLAAFAGSFSADDVAAVCGQDSREPLASLVEFNLVRQRPPDRFTMLQTIREYAAERLEQSGDSDAVRGRHCRHYLALAERAYEGILRGEESAFDSFDQAHDNLREALTWAVQTGEVELEVRLVCAMRQFWLVRGQLPEGRTFFERAVAATEGGDPRLRAQALMNGGPFLYRQGELGLARAWWEEALALLTDQQDVAGASRCAGELGSVAFSEGELDRAGELYARSAAGFESLGDRMRLGIVRGNQAEVCAMRGDLSEAVDYAEECVAIAREVNDADGLVLAIHTLARLMVRLGETRRAQALLGECFSRARDLGYREALANCVQATADMMVSGAGDLQLAARFQSVARRALEEMGVRPQGLEGQSFDRTAQALESQLGAEQLRVIDEEAAGVPLESLLDEAQARLQSEHAATSAEG